MLHEAYYGWTLGAHQRGESTKVFSGALTMDVLFCVGLLAKTNTCHTGLRSVLF